MSASRDTPGALATVAGSPSYWECTDGETILTVDLRGNTSFRKTPEWVPDPPDEGAAPASPVGSGPDEAGLVQRTRRLAASWLSTGRLSSLKQQVVKRETLLLAKLPADEITEMRGRTIVRLIRQDVSEFFQAVFDPEGVLLRIDLALEDAPTRDLCDRAILARLSPRGKSGEKSPLNLGCFFDPSLYEFEINAHSYEGEPFLDLYQAPNPFEPGDFDPKALGRVSVPDYLRVYFGSQQYHWWCWRWWERYGRVGAFRGNRLKRPGRVVWEYPQRHVVYHRSLAAYPLVEGEPGRTKVISRHLDPSFYSDLEQCHVAFLITRGERGRATIRSGAGWMSGWCCCRHRVSSALAICGTCSWIGAAVSPSGVIRRLRTW